MSMYGPPGQRPLRPPPRTAHRAPWRTGLVVVAGVVVALLIGAGIGYVLVNKTESAVSDGTNPLFPTSGPSLANPSASPSSSETPSASPPPTAAPSATPSSPPGTPASPSPTSSDGAGPSLAPLVVPTIPTPPPVAATPPTSRQERTQAYQSLVTWQTAGGLTNLQTIQSDLHVLAPPSPANCATLATHAQQGLSVTHYLPVSVSDPLRTSLALFVDAGTNCARGNWETAMQDLWAATAAVHRVILAWNQIVGS